MPDEQRLTGAERELIEALAAGALEGERKREAEQLLERGGAARELFRSLTLARFPHIANYTILEQIGKGGFGVVYRAVHHQTERVEALKVLFSKTPLLTSYFENEVHLIARLRHANIATLYDAQLRTPPLYYSMEYVHGERLNDYLKTHELSLAERIEIIKQVALAVGYAHTQGVVHRDLKPQNILVDEARQPHIVDFGIAKKLQLDEQAVPDPTAAVAAARTPEGPVGTLGYIAPEVVSGAKLDERADIFALGALLFHCVTLEPARLARDPAQRNDLLRQRRVSHPADLSAIIGRCVEKDPHRRYETCAALVEDLDSYLAGRSTRARRDPSFLHVTARVGTLLLRNYPITVRAAIVIAMATLFTYTLRAVGARAAASARPQANTVLVGFMPSTLDAIDSGDLGADIPGLNRWYVQSWRALDGRLMQALAQAKPRVVALDYYYTFEQPEFDEEFIRGAHALRARNIPLVIGAEQFDVNGEPIVARPIREAVDVVGTLINANANYLHDEFQVVYGFRRGWNPPVPGLALGAFAASRFPGCTPQLEIDAAGPWLHVRYLKKKADEGAPRWESQADRFPLHDVNRIEAGQALQLKHMMVGDEVAQARVASTDQQAWLPRTYSYEEVIGADDATLRRWFDGRAVIVGAMLPGDDSHEVKKGPPIFGCIVHAQTLDALMANSQPLRYPVREVGLYALLWSVVAGVLVSIVRPRRWRGLTLLFFTCIVVSFAGLLGAALAGAFLVQPWLFQPTLAACILATVGSLTFLARAVRERQIQLAPAAITYDAETEALPSTVLAPRSS